jgi:transposase-like protein
VTIKKVKTEDLELDDRCQARAKIDTDAVDEYAAAYERGDDLPPLEAFSVSGRLYVVDGFHRFPALVKAGKSFAKVQVVGSGTIEAAVMYATSVNQIHGVRRSNADKRRAVRMVFDTGNGADMSNAAIAEHVGVSDMLVSAVRRDVEASQPQESGGCEAPETRVGRDGKRRKAPKPKANTPKAAPEPDDIDFDAPHDPPPETAKPMPLYGSALKGAAKVIGESRRQALHLLESAPNPDKQRVERDLKQLETHLKMQVPEVCPSCEGTGCDRCRHYGWCTADEARAARDAVKKGGRAR